VKTQRKTAWKKVDLLECAAIDYFESGHGWRAPEIAQDSGLRAFLHSLGQERKFLVRLGVALWQVEIGVSQTVDSRI
jgi:hypothetical protein